MANEFLHRRGIILYIARYTYFVFFLWICFLLCYLIDGFNKTDQTIWQSEQIRDTRISVLTASYFRTENSFTYWKNVRDNLRFGGLRKQ